MLKETPITLLNEVPEEKPLTKKLRTKKRSIRTKITMFVALTGLSTCGLITAAHYLAPAYIALENDFKTKLEEIDIRLKAVIGPQVSISTPTPSVTLPLEELIARTATEEGISPYLLKALVDTESGGKEDAERFEPALNTRSIGLTQVLATWAGKTPCRDIKWVDLYQPEPNLKCGAKILSLALSQERSLWKGLVVYNGGATCKNRPGCLERASEYANKVIIKFAELSYKNNQ